MLSYYTVSEVAEKLNLSNDQIRLLVNSGELPYVDLSKPGSTRKCIRFSEKHVGDFLTSRDRTIGRQPQAIRNAGSRRSKTSLPNHSRKWV